MKSGILNAVKPAFTILFALIALGIAIRVVSNQSSAAADAIVLKADGSFRVSLIDTPRLVVQDFVANPKGLYFLLNTPAGSELVHTDFHGGAIKSVALPVSDRLARSSALRVDDEGNVVVLQQPTRKSQLLLSLDPSLNITRQLPLTRLINDFAFVGTHLIALDSLSSTLLSEPDENELLSISPPVLSPTIALSLDSNRLALIEKSTARSRIITTQTHNIDDITPVAPEIQSVLRVRSTTHAVPVIISSASVDNGFLYCSISPYRSKDGAIVVQFDYSGKLQRRFRCILPTYEDLKAPGNPDGYMIPGRIATVDHTLFVTDRQHRRCAYYSLLR